MAICKMCYNDYPDKRKQYGYNTCLDCGDKIADKEIRRKKKQTAPLFNKGGYQYIVSLDEIKSF